MSAILIRDTQPATSTEAQPQSPALRGTPPKWQDLEKVIEPFLGGSAAVPDENCKYS